MDQRKLPVICGATASGKTAVAVELAKIINGEIISADSMQVYRHLSIGTAKPTKEELQGIPYHLVDHIDPNDQYHLGRFVQEATDCIAAIQQRGKQPILCGGTGLYIRGLVHGIYEGGDPNPDIRARLEERLSDEGLPALYQELHLVDPVSATSYGVNDRQRILRALEVFQATGKPLSAYHYQDDDTPVLPAQLFVLTWPRQQLYDRINQRVDAMLDQGLLDEASSYLAKGYSEDNPAIKALGYKEVIAALRNEHPLPDAIEVMKKKSRNYAKRQETWFRSQPATIWTDASNQSPTYLAERIFQLWEKSGN